MSMLFNILILIYYVSIDKIILHKIIVLYFHQNRHIIFYLISDKSFRNLSNKFLHNP